MCLVVLPLTGVTMETAPIELNVAGTINLGEGTGLVGICFRGTSNVTLKSNAIDIEHFDLGTSRSGRDVVQRRSSGSQRSTGRGNLVSLLATLRLLLLDILAATSQLRFTTLWRLLQPRSAGKYALAAVSTGSHFQEAFSRTGSLVRSW